MKICILVVGQPRTFSLASIGLKRVFETNLRPGDELYYLPVFWNYQCSWWNRTEIQILDKDDLYRQIEESYGVDRVISPTVISFEEAEEYLGGLGFTKEELISPAAVDVNWRKFRTLHQMWLPKRAVEIFEKYTNKNDIKWDLVVFVRPDLVFWDNNVDYNALEKNLNRLRTSTDSYVNLVCSYRWLSFGFMGLRNTEMFKLDEFLKDPQRKPDIDDKFAVGTAWSVIHFFKCVWQMYLEHLKLSFEDPDGLTVYAEELWAQALLYLHCSLLDVFDPVSFQYDVLRSFFLRYSEIEKLLRSNQFGEFHDKYVYEMDVKRGRNAFIFMTEQDYLDFKEVIEKKHGNGGNLI